MASTNTQRSYRAPCPGCGAPVNFLSAQSTHAVCGYCQSTVVRNGETLSRIGKMSELFDDHSPLQLQASGVWNTASGKKPFTLVGRLQYKYAEGTWTEWHAVLMDGTSAYLSEDNGAYVFTVPLESRPDIPTPQQLRVGARIRLNGTAFVVGSNQPVSLMSAQGELPRLPPLGQSFVMVELRTEGVAAGAKSAPADASGSIIGRAIEKSGSGGNAPPPKPSGDGNQVLSIDYSSTPPALSLGATVLLEDLQLTGLKDESAKDEKGRQIACPNCGASVSVTLATSKSITCGSCHSLIDVSGGIGGELKSAIQDEPVQPLIPLGRIGQLQGVAWQVVGFQHRMGTDPADPDEHFGWDEYLLYNQKRGFTFLVDSTEGWSIVKPATGAPLVAQGGASATYLGTRYQLKESYKATTTYVAGEFYWQVSRGQTTKNRDYASGKSMLSMEESATELTWSVGGKIASEAVAAAFKLDDKKDLLKRADAGPAGTGLGCMTIIIILIVVLVLLVLMSRCSPACDPATQNCQSNSSSSSGARTSGGSYGGSIGGGGHK